MKQSALLEFESTAFPVIPGEDEHTNPGVYGKTLAQWLAEQLHAKGILTNELIAEDFGWCVPIKSKPHRLYVACASTEEKQNHWRVFAFVEGGLVSRTFGKDTSGESLASLFATIRQVLKSSQSIQRLREEAS
jgi:hypothetical protein